MLSHGVTRTAPDFHISAAAKTPISSRANGSPTFSIWTCTKDQRTRTTGLRSTPSMDMHTVSGCYSLPCIDLNLPKETGLDLSSTCLRGSDDLVLTSMHFISHSCEPNLRVVPVIWDTIPEVSA